MSAIQVCQATSRESRTLRNIEGVEAQIGSSPDAQKSLRSVQGGHYRSVFPSAVDIKRGICCADGYYTSVAGTRSKRCRSQAACHNRPSLFGVS